MRTAQHWSGLGSTVRDNLSKACWMLYIHGQIREDSTSVLALIAGSTEVVSASFFPLTVRKRCVYRWRGIHTSWWTLDRYPSGGCDEPFKITHSTCPLQAQNMHSSNAKCVWGPASCIYLEEEIYEAKCRRGNNSRHTFALPAVTTCS